MKDEHKKIKKQSYVSFFLSYCIYFYDIWLIHLLIDEITQLGIITVYQLRSVLTKKNRVSDVDAANLELIVHYEQTKTWREMAS